MRAKLNFQRVLGFYFIFLLYIWNVLTHSTDDFCAQLRHVVLCLFVVLFLITKPLTLRVSFFFFLFFPPFVNLSPGNLVLCLCFGIVNSPPHEKIVLTGFIWQPSTPKKEIELVISTNKHYVMIQLFPVFVCFSLNFNICVRASVRVSPLFSLWSLNWHSTRDGEAARKEKSSALHASVLVFHTIIQWDVWLVELIFSLSSPFCPQS